MLFEQLKGGLHDDSENEAAAQPQNKQPKSIRKYEDLSSDGIPLAAVDKKR